MKLRIKGNSLRLRISRSEVERIVAGHCLEETIHFAPEAGAGFTYALKREPSVRVPTVQHTENRLVILIPADQADVWASTDQVGIARDIGLGDFGSLALLVEKDFACLDRSEEENADTFPHPDVEAQCQPHAVSSRFRS